MIRLTELKLPLEHAADALPALIAQTLGIDLGAITRFTIYKRSFDARKADLLQVYIVDVEIAPTLGTVVSSLPPEGALAARDGPSPRDAAPTLEASLLEKFAQHPHIGPSPDLV